MSDSIETPLILLTNDDGIASPGLVALVEAMAGLGDILVVAPRHQQSASGRSLGRLGEIRAEHLQVDVPLVGAYSVEGSPAMAARVGVMLLAGRPVAAAVAGINYGENIGVGITISGTVGAAIETASVGIPSIAISVETDVVHHFSHSDQIDFSVAAAFVRQLVQTVLAGGLPPSVDVLKVDVPSDATIGIPWKLTHLTRQRYFESTVETDAGGVSRFTGYVREIHRDSLEPDSDAHALLVDRMISVCPLTIDLSARAACGLALDWPPT